MGGNRVEQHRVVICRMDHAEDAQDDECGQRKSS